jgi:anti-anti-sigma regulatory factor
MRMIRRFRGLAGEERSHGEVDISNAKHVDEMLVSKSAFLKFDNLSIILRRVKFVDSRLIFYLVGAT